mgnify:CR=1 FL=1
MQKKQQIFLKNLTKISDYTSAGWRIVDKNEKRLECVLEKGGDYLLGLHLFLTLITVFWSIVWYLQYKKINFVE